MKTITLINPPWFFVHEKDIILSQNLGIGYLTAFLMKNGHDVNVIDALAEGVANCKKMRLKQQKYIQVGLDYADIVGRINADSDFIGISAPFTNNARIVKELAREIKKSLPDIPIILGGVYPSLMIEDAFCKEIDYYVIGEGELPLLDILSGINPEDIQGVISYNNPNKLKTAARIIENLDEIPFPARDKLPMSKYLSFNSPRRDRIKTASMITSRGCPFDCTFCSIHSITGYKWRKRSAADVISEIELLINKFGVEHIEFEDDNLTFEKKRAQEIVNGITLINSKGGKISWSAPNGLRVDTLDAELLRQIKDSNCSYLNLAAESGDPELLKIMNKKLDLNTVVEVVKICKELGIKTKTFFMIGYPGETDESFLKTLEFIKKLKKNGLSGIMANVTRAYPGTKLYYFSKEKNYIAENNSRDNLFLVNTINKENVIITPDFDLKKIKKRMRLIDKTVNPFYLRFYYKNYFYIKKVIPLGVIRLIKKILGKKV